MSLPVTERQPGALQRSLYDFLDPDPNPSPLERTFNLLLGLLIVVNVASVVVASVPGVPERYAGPLKVLEVFSLVVFTAEYLGRVYVAPLKPGSVGGWRGRLAWMLSPLGLIDLGVLLALALPGLTGLGALRSLRLLKLFSILKFGRYSGALSLIGRVIVSRREELLTTVLIVFVLVLLSATALFNLEGGSKGFESIPDSMWWAVVTLCTVGYGDVYPVTAAGRVVAGFVMLLGIGTVALPAGLIASGFAEELARRRRKDCCPHCGEELRE